MDLATRRALRRLLEARDLCAEALLELSGFEVLATLDGRWIDPTTQRTETFARALEIARRDAEKTAVGSTLRSAAAALHHHESVVARVGGYVPTPSRGGIGYRTPDERGAIVTLTEAVEAIRTLLVDHVNILTLYAGGGMSA